MSSPPPGRPPSAARAALPRKRGARALVVDQFRSTAQPTRGSSMTGQQMVPPPMTSPPIPWKSPESGRRPKGLESARRGPLVPFGDVGSAEKDLDRRTAGAMRVRGRGARTGRVIRSWLIHQPRRSVTRSPAKGLRIEPPPCRDEQLGRGARSVRDRTRVRAGQCFVSLGEIPPSTLGP